MKKLWEQPTLEILEVNKTMHSATGTHFDDTYQDGTPVPTDGHGHLLVLS